MRKIAVSLSKGGVGKTTTAVNLAAGLAKTGAQVLLIDTDTQGQCSKALGIEAGLGVAEVIAEEVGLAEAMVEARAGLHLLRGGRRLAGIKRLIAMRSMAGERILSEALQPLGQDYQFVILDTGPNWDSLSINVLFYAEEILSPVSLEALSVEGLKDFLQSVGEVQRYNEDLALRYILPTFLDKRVKKSTEILEQLWQNFGERLCRPIRYNVRLSEAPAHGKDIYEYAPRSTGAEDYARLVERVAKDDR